MGGYSSKGGFSPSRSDTEWTNLLMPLYYTKIPPSDDEYYVTYRSWQLILDDQSPVFKKNKAEDPTRFTYSSCTSFFYATFYERLFDIHPLSKELFRDLTKQGHFLVRMITTAFSYKTDRSQFEATLARLAHTHNERGVKASEYGIVGEVLFWTLQACLGRDVYIPSVHQGWVKLYCQMLTVMIPIVINYEVNNGEAHEQRVIGIRLGMSKQEEHAFLHTVKEFHRFEKQSKELVRQPKPNTANGSDDLITLMLQTVKQREEELIQQQQS